MYTSGTTGTPKVRCSLMRGGMFVWLCGGWSGVRVVTRTHVCATRRAAPRQPAAAAPLLLLVGLLQTLCSPSPRAIVFPSFSLSASARAHSRTTQTLLPALPPPRTERAADAGHSHCLTLQLAQGVLLTHHAVASVVDAMVDWFFRTGQVAARGDVFFSFLPLAHIYGR